MFTLKKNDNFPLQHVVIKIFLSRPPKKECTCYLYRFLFSIDTYP